MQLIIFQAKNSVPVIEFQYIKFSFELEEFDIKKSDINNEQSNLKTKDEQFDQGEEIDENFLYQDPKILPPLVLKQNNLEEKNL